MSDEEDDLQSKSLQRSIDPLARRQAGLEHQQESSDLDTYEDLWISSKRSRLTEYQRDAEDINNYVSTHGIDEMYDKLLKIKHRSMKSSAEEMGHLPARTTIQVAQTSLEYKIYGVSVEDFK